MGMSDARLLEVHSYLEEHGDEKAAKMLGVSVETLYRYERRYKNTGEETVLTAKPILVVPDTHIPYNHPDMIPFLKWVQKTKGCRRRVVHVGDLMDFHSMSRHTTEQDSPSPEDEYNRAKEIVEEFAEEFPEGDLVLGNHDCIPQRQMKEVGLAPSMLKDYRELYGLPKGWDIHPLYHLIDEWNVLVEHGVGSAGKMGCLNTAILKRCSYIQGHTHSNAAVMFSSNYNSTIFGMNVGWLGSEGSLAVRYAKYHVKKGVLGCGVVYSSEYAEFIPMQTWKK